MKCTNKILKFFLPAVLIAALLAFMLTGCSTVSGLSDTYQVFNTSSEYQLTGQKTDSSVSFFAEDLCVGGTENTKSSSVNTASIGAAAVFSVSDNKITYAKNIYQKIYPASTTKILTAYLALKYGDLDEKITVSSTAVDIPSDASKCGLKAGDHITLRQALYGLLLCSGNDAANVIAETISGSNEKFADLMNKEAVKLGATHSHFVNPHGYPDDSHYTTAYDLYLIFNAATQNETFLKYISTSNYTITYKNASGQKVEQFWKNTDWYVNGTLQSPKGITVVGGKTGTSNSAGHCLVLYSKNKDSDPVISIVLKSYTSYDLYRLTSELLANYSE